MTKKQLMEYFGQIGEDDSEVILVDGKGREHAITSLGAKQPIKQVVRKNKTGIHYGWVQGPLKFYIGITK